VLPGAVLTGTLGITIASLKVVHYYQQKAALKRQAEHYLGELADELEKIQQDKQAKQAQFEQKYLVLPN
jgi:hypothetical protein